MAHPPKEDPLKTPSQEKSAVHTPGAPIQASKNQHASKGSKTPQQLFKEETAEQTPGAPIASRSREAPKNTLEPRRLF